MGVGGGILVSEWMCGGAHWLVNGCVWGGGTLVSECMCISLLDGCANLDKEQRQSSETKFN